MRQFNLFSKGRLIGWSHLENVDPRKYQASGKFTPAGDYDKVMAEIAATPGTQDLPDLSLQTEQGEPLTALFIHLMPRSLNNNPGDQNHDAIEVLIIGLLNTSFKRLLDDLPEQYTQTTQDINFSASIIIVNLDRREE